MGGTLALKSRICLVFATLLAASAAHAETVLKFTTQDFAPFNYLADGKVAGPAYEIIVKACARIAVNCSFELLPWTRAQQEVFDGIANGMFVIGWNQARSKILHFSPPLMNTEYGFFVRTDNPLRYKSLGDMQNMTVAAYGPSNTSVSLQRLRKAMITQKLKPLRVDIRPDGDAGFKKLAAGRVDAVFSNREVGYGLIAKLGLQGKVRYAGKTEALDYYIGFMRAHNDPALLARFDSAITAVMTDGSAKAILDKFGMRLPLKEQDLAKTMRP